jgi:hypothetical protein
MSENKDMMLNNVRLSFPDLFKAKAFEEGKQAKYGASFLIDPDTKEGAKLIKSLTKEMNILAKANWPKKIPKGLKKCLRDGDDQDYDGYEGMMFVSSASETRPHVVDRRRQPVVEADDIVYAGCFVNAKVRLWCMDNQYGTRIAAEIIAVQYVSAGEAFGKAPVDIEDTFDMLDDVDDDDDDDDDMDDLI